MNYQLIIGLALGLALAIFLLSHKMCDWFNEHDD